jgi:hypothetical protein
VDWDTVSNFLSVLFWIVAICLILFALLLTYAVYRLKKIRVPADADFGETLLVTPLALVIAIDLLDFGLDILSAPITWIVLDRLGLKSLRGISFIQAFVPLTQPIPVMTLCWLAVHFYGPRIFRNPTRILERIRGKNSGAF